VSVDRVNQGSGWGMNWDAINDSLRELAAGIVVFYFVSKKVIATGV